MVMCSYAYAPVLDHGALWRSGCEYPFRIPTRTQYSRLLSRHVLQDMVISCLGAKSWVAGGPLNGLMWWCEYPYYVLSCVLYPRLLSRHVLQDMVVS